MKPDVTSYSDYRKYLKDSYDHRKQTSNGFSFRQFAKKAGFSSPNFLQLVIDGKRNLTKDSVMRFSNALELGKKEQYCFEALVFLNQSSDPEIKRYYLELLHNLKNTQLGTDINDEQFEYLSKWYYPVIRELISLPHFSENPAWIREQLSRKISINEVKNVIEKLLSMGLIKRNDDGKLVQTNENVTTGHEARAIATKDFHEQMLAISKEMVGHIKREGRDLSALTMAVSEKQFAEIKRRIHEFKDSIVNYLTCTTDVPASVCQLNIQLFNIAQDMEAKDA